MQFAFRTGLRSQALADCILEEVGMALLRGTGFGARAEGFLRVSFAAGVYVNEEALRRLERFFALL